MGEGEMDSSSREAFSGCCSTPGAPSSGVGDALLKNARRCARVHAGSSLSGLNAERTRACYRTHMQVFTAVEEEGSVDRSHRQPGPPCKKRPPGNRKAVKKYREKKKAHAAYLEEEVSQLKVLNQQLMKKLQSQAALEAEKNRLRTLLSEFRGRIDGELATFPGQRACAGSVRLRTDRASSVARDNYPMTFDFQFPHSPLQPDSDSHQ